MTLGERDHIRNDSNTTGVVGERRESVNVSVFRYEVVTVDCTCHRR